MKIAVVSQFNSPGGGSRFLRCLIGGLVDSAEVERIGLFVDSAAIERDSLTELYGQHPKIELHPTDAEGRESSSGITVRGLRAWARGVGPLVALYRFLKFDILRRPVEPLPVRVRLSKAVEVELEGYDVVYFAWPRLIVPPDIATPLAATFHDFNFRHDFGNVSVATRDMLDDEMHQWLEGTVWPISSTPFIRDELLAAYPSVTHTPAVVYLSSFALHSPSAEDVERVLLRDRLSTPYLVAPINISPHKNLARVLLALAELKRQGFRVPLVLTGHGTRLVSDARDRDPVFRSAIGGYMRELQSIVETESLVIGQDVVPLGYVTDEDMDSLIAGALAVVAPSLYEAGSGPAVDAWRLGTAVISSDIESVRQQLDFLGTKAILFDPTQVADIARAIRVLVEDEARRVEMVHESAAAIAQYTWEDVANGYLRVFRKAIEAHGT